MPAKSAADKREHETRGQGAALHASDHAVLTEVDSSQLHLDAPDTIAMQAGPCTDRPQSAHHCFAGDEAEGHEEGLRLGPSELPVAQHSCCTLGRRGWHWGGSMLQLLACSLAVQPHILCGCSAFSLVLLAAGEQQPD